jgi:hypothetical protein
LRTAIFTANSLALLLHAFTDNMDKEVARLAEQIREQLNIAVSLVSSEEDRYYIEKAEREGAYLCSNWYAGRSQKYDQENKEGLDDDENV